MTTKRKLKGDEGGGGIRAARLKHQKSRLNLIKEALPSPHLTSSRGDVSYREATERVVTNPVYMPRSNDREKFALLMNFRRLGEGYSPATPISAAELKSQRGWTPTPTSPRGNGSSPLRNEQMPPDKARKSFRDTLRRNFLGNFSHAPKEGSEISGSEESLSPSAQYRTERGKRRRKTPTPVTADSLRGFPH